jgi:anti-sigma B factor antagonist
MCIDCVSSPSGRMAIEVEAGPGMTTIFLRGELDLVSLPFLDKCLTQVLGEAPGRLVVDMAGTDFIDCGCARLIAGASRALPPGARLVIRHPGSGVRRILELTGLEDYCEVEG